jgi:hypothetical protein
MPWNSVGGTAAAPLEQAAIAVKQPLVHRVVSRLRPIVDSWTRIATSDAQEVDWATQRFQSPFRSTRRCRRLMSAELLSAEGGRHRWAVTTCCI